MHPCVLLARCGSNVSNKSHHDRQRMSCHAYKASLILITFNPISPTIYSSHEEPRKQDTPSVSSSYVSHLHIPPSISNPRISSDQNATATSQIMTIVTWRQKTAQSKQKIMHGHGLSMPCWVTQVFVRLLRGRPRSWEPRSHTITCSLPCRNARSVGGVLLLDESWCCANNIWCWTQEYNPQRVCKVSLMTVRGQKTSSANVGTCTPSLTHAGNTQSWESKTVKVHLYDV